MRLLQSLLIHLVIRVVPRTMLLRLNSHVDALLSRGNSHNGVSITPNWRVIATSPQVLLRLVFLDRVTDVNGVRIVDDPLRLQLIHELDPSLILVLLNCRGQLVWARCLNDVSHLPLFC